MSVRASSLEEYAGSRRASSRHSPLCQIRCKINGFLKTKYGTMPVVRAVKNRQRFSSLPDRRFYLCGAMRSSPFDPEPVEVIVVDNKPSRIT